MRIALLESVPAKVCQHSNQVRVGGEKEEERENGKRCRKKENEKKIKRKEFLIIYCRNMVFKTKSNNPLES